MRILVLEDDVDLRESLVELLNKEGFVSDGVSTLSGYHAWVRTHSCDVIIADRKLPDGDGIDALAHHKRVSYGFAIILSAFGELEDRILGFDSDADVYLVKPVEFGELKSILESFRRRLASVGEAQAWSLDPVGWVLQAPSGVKVKLTRTQLGLTSNFVERPGIAVPKEEIILSLGGNPDFYDPKRLEASVRRLKRKVLSETGMPFPLESVYGVGYSLKGFLSKR